MHPPQPPSNNPPQMSSEDQLTLLMVAPFVLGMAFAALPAMSAKATAWLVAHNLLVAAAQSPLYAVPGGDGAGLDLRRIVLVVALLSVAAALAFSGIRRRIDLNRQNRLRMGDRK
jgi:peptidoglycan/LPS O-acetylase OafA/YrhL